MKLLRRRATVVLTLLATLAAGCASEPTAPRPKSAAATVQQGGTVVVSGTLGDPANGFNFKNPKSNNAAPYVQWRGVWRVNPESEFELNTDLVESAELVSTEPQTAVYKINPKAVWSDGVPVTAEDFIYNWQVGRPGALDIDGTPLQASLSAVPLSSVTGSEDGRTVTAVFSERYALWKSGFTPFNALVPAHVAKRVGWNSGFDRFDPTVVVSNGPYRIESYRPGQDLTLVRNERYGGPPAILDRVVFRFTSDAEWVTAFRNGEVDVLRAGEPSEDLLAQVKGLAKVAYRITPGASQEYVGFNFRNELLAIPEVRKAIALAVDRPGITERVLGRDAHTPVVNSFLLANNQPGYRDNSGGRFERPDVPAAKRLLEGAGFVMGADGVYARDGKRLSFRARSQSEGGQVVAQIVQAQARQVGVELRLDAAPVNVLVPQLNRGDFDIELINYGKNMTGTLNHFRPGNRWAYPNPKPDELIQQSSRELDDQRRRALLDQADAMLWEDLPILPLYQHPVLLLWRDSLVNVERSAGDAGLQKAAEWGWKAKR